MKLSLPFLVEVANSISALIDLQPDEVTDHLQALQADFDATVACILQTESEDFLHSHVKCPENCCGILIEGLGQ